MNKEFQKDTLYPIKQIEEKLSGVSAKFESANILIQKMREEVQKWLNSILEVGTPQTSPPNFTMQFK